MSYQMFGLDIGMFSENYGLKIDYWLDWFNQQTDSNNKTEKWKIDHIICFLKDKAFEFYVAEIMEKLTTWEDICNSLKSRFPLSRDNHLHVHQKIRPMTSNPISTAYQHVTKYDVSVSSNSQTGFQPLTTKSQNISFKPPTKNSFEGSNTQTFSAPKGPLNAPINKGILNSTDSTKDVLKNNLKTQKVQLTSNIKTEFLSTQICDTLQPIEDISTNQDSVLEEECIKPQLNVSSVHQISVSTMQSAPKIPPTTSTISNSSLNTSTTTIQSASKELLTKTKTPCLNSITTCNVLTPPDLAPATRLCESIQTPKHFEQTSSSALESRWSPVKVNQLNHMTIDLVKTLKPNQVFALKEIMKNNHACKLKWLSPSIPLLTPHDRGKCHLPELRSYSSVPHDILSKRQFHKQTICIHKYSLSYFYLDYCIAKLFIFVFLLLKLCVFIIYIFKFLIFRFN